MDYRKLISDSWQYTQQNRSLIYWFGFLPAVFTTTYGVGYIIYQFMAFKTSPLFSSGDKEESFLFNVVAFIVDFLKEHITWSIPLIVAAVIFFIFLFLMPTLAKASAIHHIARSKNGQDITLGKSLKYGILSFLKLFEYHLLIKTFSFFSILTEMSFVLRNTVDIFRILFPIFLLFIFVGLLLTLLFTYSDFFIVIDNDDIFPAIKRSSRMVIFNWKHTFLITFLMLIIGVRIILQVVLVFLIPVLILLITGYLAAVALPLTGIIAGAIVGILLLLVASYLNGVVDVFSYAVWTFTFLDLTKEKEISAREEVAS